LKTVFPSVADGLPIEVPNTDELWKYPHKSDQIFFPWENSGLPTGVAIESSGLERHPSCSKLFTDFKCWRFRE
jgi:hypothetical protein